jgi:hypothetical protein
MELFSALFVVLNHLMVYKFVMPKRLTLRKKLLDKECSSIYLPKRASDIFFISIISRNIQSVTKISVLILTRSRAC